MEQNSLRIFCFLLKLVLFLQLTSAINQFQLGTNATQPELYERITNIEFNNRIQANEISLLRTKGIEDRNEIYQLRGRVAHLEAAASYFTNKTNDQETFERQKRPARLLPLQLLQGKKKNETDQKVTNMKRVYGPPTDCKDLNAIGYTLNGYYLVRGIKNSNSNKTEIQTVYCRFKQPQGNQLGENRFDYETKIGVVDVKSSSVHFYVTRVGEFSNDGGRKKMIKFLDQVLNEGNGFDWANQWFRAPYPGTYFFSISGTKNACLNDDQISIFIRLNGQRNGEALGSGKTRYGSFSSQISLKLNATDKIEVELNNGIVYLVHFTGWMVEQDLFT